MKNLYSRARAYIIAHKFITACVGIVALILIIVIYRRATTASAQTRYVLGTVTKGTLISTVSGTGQIASTNQVDIKPKVSGDITYVGVNAGQAVKAGTIIAKINSTDAQKTYRDASVNLTSAKIAYQKALQQSQTDVSSARDNLSKSYDDGFNAMTSAFVDLPTMINDLKNILVNQNHSPYLSNNYLNNLSTTAANDKSNTSQEFSNASNEYQQNLTDFQTISRTSDPTKIKAVIDETYKTTKDLASTEKDLNNLIGFVKSQVGTTTEMVNDQDIVASYITKINGYVSDLYTAKIGIENANRTLSQKTTSINGSDPLDIQSAKLTLQQKQNALTDAAQTLAEYTVRAPFDGIIGKVDAQVANGASASTALATIITKNSIATIALNEIDIAKIQNGQKVTLTFDAVPDLSITGTVAQVDQIGTISQGVVSYNVQITFDTQDSRIKPGMSISAAVVTNVKPDVLMVPTSAIKTTGGNKVVQIASGQNVPMTSATQAGVVLAAQPQSIQVETGDANDTDTEITSGLSEGDVIVTRTISGTAVTTQTAGNQRSGAGALFGGGGGARIGR
jgi:HlyD family secretion protein